MQFSSKPLIGHPTWWSMARRSSGEGGMSCSYRGPGRRHRRTKTSRMRVLRFNGLRRRNTRLGWEATATKQTVRRPFGRVSQAVSATHVYLWRNWLRSDFVRCSLLARMHCFFSAFHPSVHPWFHVIGPSDCKQKRPEKSVQSSMGMKGASKRKSSFLCS